MGLLDAIRNSLRQNIVRPISGVGQRGVQRLSNYEAAVREFVRNNPSPYSYAARRTQPQTSGLMKAVRNNLSLTQRAQAPDREENVNLFNKTKQWYGIPESWRRNAPAVIPRNAGYFANKANIGGYATANGKSFVYDDMGDAMMPEIAAHEMQHQNTFKQPGSRPFADFVAYSQQYLPSNYSPYVERNLQAGRLEKSLSPVELGYLKYVGRPYGEGFWRSVDEPVSWLRTFYRRDVPSNPLLKKYFQD